MNKKVLASIISLTAVCTVGVSLVYASPWKESAFSQDAVKTPPKAVPTENMLDISERLEDNKTMESKTEKSRIAYKTDKTTKQSIFFKMLNTIDYFESAKGKIEISNQGRPTNAEFACNLLTADCYEYAVDDVEVYETYSSSDTSFYNIFPNRNEIYKGLGSCNIKEATPIPDSERVTLAEDGINCYSYRADPTNTGFANCGLQSQELTFNFMTVEDNWEIAENTKYLGRECVVIKGNTNDYAEEKLNVYTFEFTVDTQTGVLLKYNGFNENGELESYHYFTEIEFNCNPEIKKFDISNYPNCAVTDMSVKH